mmetsp:Transcript_53740/g.149069  ORF Transcript_53740/g.149069 Transcript_53740/m.149069 type:complete len:230 (-) Transcript_53740:1121-1810(-)
MADRADASPSDAKCTLQHLRRPCRPANCHARAVCQAALHVQLSLGHLRCSGPSLHRQRPVRVAAPPLGEPRPASGPRLFLLLPQLVEVRGHALDLQERRDAVLAEDDLGVAHVQDLPRLLPGHEGPNAPALCRAAVAPGLRPRRASSPSADPLGSEVEGVRVGSVEDPADEQAVGAGKMLRQASRSGPRGVDPNAVGATVGHGDSVAPRNAEADPEDRVVVPLRRSVVA